MRLYRQLVSTLPRGLLIIVGAALLVRLGLFTLVATQTGTEPFITSDSHIFLQVAHNILSGHGFSQSEVPPYRPDAHFPPLYPLLIVASLATTGSFIPLLILQIILSATIPILAFFLAQHIGFGPRAGLMAAAFAAFEPMMMFWGFFVLTETFAIFFVLLALLFFLKWHETETIGSISASGLFLGLSVLVRPHAQFLFPLAILFFGILCYRRWSVPPALRRIAISAGVFILFFGAILAPWLIRNYLTFGALTPSATGLRNFYTSLAPAVLSLETGGSSDELNDELTRKFARRRGIAPEEIRENPSYGGELAREGLTIIARYPKSTAKVIAFSFVAFFTQDLYLDYFKRLQLISTYPLDFSPTYILATEGPVALMRLVGERVGWYAAIPLIGRLFWVSVLIFAIIGCWIAIRNQKARTAALIMAAVIAGYALTSVLAGFSDYGRFRYPANTLLFVLAAGGFVSMKIVLTRKMKSFSQRA